MNGCSSEKLLGEWSTSYVSPKMNRLLANDLTAGIDEVGRGPLAGPVVVAAVVLPPRVRNARIVDSKQLTALQREEVFEEILDCALAYSVAFVGPATIDVLNIREATRYAMARCADALHDALRQKQWTGGIRFLVDGNVSMTTTHPQETIIRGDQKVRAISAASIVAKVSRDREMAVANTLFPGYGFDEHKGYGTEYHRARIKELGPCALHRNTFGGVKEYLAAAEGAAEQIAFDLLAAEPAELLS